MTDSNVPPPPEWTTPQPPQPPAEHSPWAPPPAEPTPPPAEPTPPPASPGEHSVWPPPPPPPPQYAWQPGPQYGVPPTPPLGASMPSYYTGSQAADEELAVPAPLVKSSRPRILAVVAAVVIAAGAAVTYTALNDASSGGAASPQAAVRNAIDDLQKADVIGLLDDLPSGERAAFMQPFQDDVASLKRLNVLSSAADPHKVSGVSFTAQNLSFSTDVTVNDHVDIVRLTGGTITANATALKLPLSAHLLALTHAAQASPTTSKVDLAQVNGGVRIATVKQSGRWYVSIFYTAADAAAKHAIPAASDFIAAKGADSPTAAVKSLVMNLVGGKLADALALISPDELGAIHDYGGLLLHSGSGFQDTGVQINTLDLKQAPLSDGLVRVTLSKVALSTADGHDISVSETGSCYTATIDGKTTHECAADAAKSVEQLITGFKCFGFSPLGSSSGSGSGVVPIGPDGQPVITDPGSSGGSSSDGSGDSSGSSSGSSPGTFPGGEVNPTCPQGDLTAAQKAAITHLMNGLTDYGLIVSQSGGAWYVEPVRSVSQLTDQVISSLQGNDVYALISIFTG